jgi:hemerythrin
MNESFTWNEYFTTGLDAVDTQHQHLVKMINEFGEQIITKEDLDATFIEKLYQDLAGYAVYHFAEEQRLMGRHGLDSRHIHVHRLEHKVFLDEVTRLHDQLDLQGSTPGFELFEYLTSWLTYHILGRDQEMARQIQLIETGLSPQEAHDKVENTISNARNPLLSALNRLFAQVSQRNRELAQLNHTLEAKVAERTRALEEANDYLEVLANTDLLTELPNRRHAMALLEKWWSAATTDGIPLVCMMIDADGFKQINDRHGHDAGDLVLRELSKNMRNALRTDDFIARMGGDEFMVLLPSTPLEGGLSVARGVHASVSGMSVRTGEGRWNGSISVGVAAKTADMAAHEALIKAADSALYQAKARGKNRVEACESAPSEA